MVMAPVEISVNYWELTSLNNLTTFNGLKHMHFFILYTVCT